MKKMTFNELNLTDREKADLGVALVAAAVTYAELWDVLRRIETAHTDSGKQLEIEISNHLITDIAADLNCPPSYTDMGAEVLDYFQEDAEIKEYSVEQHVTGL